MGVIKGWLGHSVPPEWAWDTLSQSGRDLSPVELDYWSWI